MDISVFKEDLTKLEKLLSEQGFGVFINFEEDGKRLTKRITAEELTTINNPYLSICKIGPEGKIERGGVEPFKFVDLHVHSKNEEGDTVISYNGMALPKEFFKPVKKRLPGGKEINLSQPVIVAYYKLHSDRLYDLTDLQRLKLYLKASDFGILRELLEREIEEIERKGKEKLQEVWESLSSILKFTRDPKAISEKLWMHPSLKKTKKQSENLEICFFNFPIHF